MNNERIAQLLRSISDSYKWIADEFGKAEAPPYIPPVNDPPYVPPAPPPAPDIPPVQPPPSTGAYQVLISFMEHNHNWIGETIDVWLNGQKFALRGKGQNDPIWTQFLHGSRGVVVTIDKPLTLIELDPNQIIRIGAPNFGYGTFGYKVGAAPAGQDLNNIVDAPVNSIHYWATWNTPHEAAHVSRLGENGTGFDNVEFYRREIPLWWNSSKKYKVLIGRSDTRP